MLYTDISLMTCMLGAQPTLANWVETHPRWQISRWSCQALRKDRET